ncbi:zinc ABC transporter substrate-binding protein [Candidatus Uhrbacteria bacterium]|nr:zinc ABC transporter substrate-binding protein [Candidatus Uhrbacteria bacterium]
MKFFWITLGAAALIIVFGLAGLQKRTDVPSSKDDRIQVAATIYPLYDFVREVAGDYVDVHLIVPSGASPHLYEFTPRQLQDLQGIRVLFDIGHGIDAWATRLESVAPEMQRVTVDKGIVLRKEAANDHEEDEHGENADGIDPHYWLHFGNARMMVATIAEGLVAADPVHASVYQENAVRYQKKLAEKEQELPSLLAPLRGTRIVSLHDAWYYFSDNFGLIVAGTFEPAAGGEPTPQYLANLRAEIKSYGIPVLFSEPQLATPSLSSFANDEGLRLGIIDPLGGSQGRMTYLELMEYNVRSIIGAFSDIPIQQ